MGKIKGESPPLLLMLMYKSAETDSAPDTSHSAQGLQLLQASQNIRLQVLVWTARYAAL